MEVFEDRVYCNSQHDFLFLFLLFLHFDSGIPDKRGDTNSSSSPQW